VPVKTAPLSVSTEAGIPHRVKAFWKVLSTTGPVTRARARLVSSSREWSSSMLRISTSAPSASRQWVVSACQRSFGWSAANRCQDDLGRFCGCGTTNPRRDRIRQIVDVAGTDPVGAVRARCAAIVSAPASRPSRVSCLRSRTIVSSTSAGIACGLWCGRLDRGANAASPSARYRWTSVFTHCRDTW
jgi:hypothetical protein